MLNPQFKNAINCNGFLATDGAHTLKPKELSAILNLPFKNATNCNGFLAAEGAHVWLLGGMHEVAWDHNV